MAITIQSSPATSIAARVQATVQPNSGKGTLKIVQNDIEREYEFTLFDNEALDGKALKVDIGKVVEKVARYVLNQINNQFIESADIDLDGLSVEDFTQEVGESSDREIDVSGHVNYTEDDAAKRKELLDTWNLETLLDANAELPSETIETTSSSSSKATIIPLFSSSSSAPPEAPTTEPTVSSISSAPSPSAPPQEPTAEPTVSSNSPGPNPSVTAESPVLSSSATPQTSTEEPSISSNSSTPNPSVTAEVAELPASSSSATPEATTEEPPVSSNSSAPNPTVTTEAAGPPVSTNSPIPNPSSKPQETIDEPSALSSSAPSVATIAEPAVLSTSSTSTPPVTPEATIVSGLATSSTSTPSISSESSPSEPPAIVAKKRVTLQIAKKTNKLTLKIAPKVTLSAIGKPEESTPKKLVLPVKLKDVPSFHDILKNGKILSEVEANLILDFSVDVTAEKRAELLSNLMTSAIWDKAIKGVFKESENNIKQLEEKKASLVVKKEKLENEEKELSSVMAKLEAEEKKLKDKIIVKEDMKIHFDRERAELLELEYKQPNDSQIKQKKILIEAHIKRVSEAIEKLKVDISDVSAQRSSTLALKWKVGDELTKVGGISERVKDAELDLEKAKVKHAKDIADLSTIHTQENNKQRAARDALQELNNAPKVAPLNEEYKKRFENQFFIQQFAKLSANGKLTEIVTFGLVRGVLCQTRWKALEMGFRDPKITEESSFVLGVEARAHLNAFLGAVDETFENKPFVKECNPNNKKTRPYLTSLVGEYVPQAQQNGNATSFLGESGNGMLYRNGTAPYFETPPEKWDGGSFAV